MLRRMVIAFVVFFVAGCTVLKVAETDPKTGYFPAEKKAEVKISKPVDLDSRKTLVLVPNSDFAQGQVRNIRYFDEVFSFDDLEKRIIAENLGSKVSSIRDRIGINNAAKHYKPFLWLRYNFGGTGNSRFAQLILTDPLTMEDYFSAETHLDFLFTGVNDQNNWYPMYNALIDYIKQYSKSYRK